MFLHGWHSLTTGFTHNETATDSISVPHCSNHEVGVMRLIRAFNLCLPDQGIGSNHRH